jgi:uncharacterized damage-inducible protein DinB
MYNAATLSDIHTRAHESFRRLTVFCSALTPDELRRPLTGFGFSTVLRQLEHTIGAEVYWQTVVTRGYTEEATMPDLPDIAAVEAFCGRTAAVTRSYLDGASDAELNSMRQMISDPGQTRMLRPADVIMRIVTHMFNHQGQVLAMWRTLGRPNDDTHDLDYPLDEKI